MISEVMGSEGATCAGILDAIQGTIEAIMKADAVQAGTQPESRRDFLFIAPPSLTAVSAPISSSEEDRMRALI
jgi:hypothetical protein